MSSLPKPPLGPPPDWLQAAPAEMERLRDYLLNGARQLDWSQYEQRFREPGDHRHSVNDPGHSHGIWDMQPVNPAAVVRAPRVEVSGGIPPHTMALAMALARAMTDPKFGGNAGLPMQQWLRLKGYVQALPNNEWLVQGLELSPPPPEPAKPAPVARKGWRY